MNWLRFLWELFKIPFEKREPLMCQQCGADMGEQPIRNTSKGCRINCGRCGAFHEYVGELHDE